MVATSDELFATFQAPPHAFSPVSILWFGGDPAQLDKLRFHFERQAEAGVYNLYWCHLAPFGPMHGSDADEPAMFSEAWWELLQAACEAARETGVRLWLYDPIGHPGAGYFQSELLRERRDFAGQWLESDSVEVEGPAQVPFPRGSEPLAASAAALGGAAAPGGPPIALAVADGGAQLPHPGRWRVRLVYVARRDFDFLDPEACRALLDRTYGEYVRRLGAYLGGVAVGAFQDELPARPTWTSAFADEFRRRRGYDLLSRLPALWDADGPEGERVRADYHAVRAALAEEAWFKPQAAWFSRYGMICGFDTDDGARYAEPVNAVVRYADYPRTHRWYGAPGTDHRGDPKFYSSLAHLYGLPRVWLEAFHSSGWGATPEETFDWLLPWLRAGATLWDPHAVYYSTRGGWWEWAPLSYCWRQPYWRHFRLLTLAVTRLGWLLSQGRHVCDIAVLYPTAAVHAHLTPTGPLPEATAISAAYLELVGRLTWEDKRVGALDRERRDFDVVDDASVQQSQVADGLLVIGSEQYGVVILPRCTALERATAARLCAFVEAGGRLVAVGEAPALEVDGDGAQVGRLRALLESGRAICVAGAADVPAALADRPRAIEAPVPVLHRRDGDRAIVFVSAAFPGAAQVDGRIPDIQVDLDHARYARTMRLRVTGVTGDPDLWDPFTGERCCVPARAVPGGVEVDVTFPHGPAAVLVWPGAPSSPRLLPAPIRVWQRVDGPWAVRLEPTLDNRFGDFALPAHAGAPPVQTWRFEHRLEPDGVDGLAAGWWGGGAPAEGWAEASATVGAYAWVCGPAPAAQLPSPGGDEPGGTEVASWRPVRYSLTRGIPSDPLHRPTQGPKGHVPEEFIHVGQLRPGEGVQLRTAVWCDAPERLHLAIGAPAAKTGWWNGVALGAGPTGYLWQLPVDLRAGRNVLEFRLVADEAGPLRAYWALVRDTGRFARPEWLTLGERAEPGSVVRFTHPFILTAAAESATIQVNANAPSRTWVDGTEIGYEESWDLHSPGNQFSGRSMRPRRYRVEGLTAGQHALAVELTEQAWPAAVLVDARIRTQSGTESTFWSGPMGWSAQRDGGPARCVRLRRRQWHDPAWSHLWRRPHPLPGSDWLESAPSDGTVVPVVPDARAGPPRVEWFRWTVPPGATAMSVPVLGEARLWVDGHECVLRGGAVALPRLRGMASTAILRLVPERGRTEGACLAGPVSYVTGPGVMRLGAWHEQGLAAYAGGVRYTAAVAVAHLPDGPVWLDAGRVRGTAEVWVNGRSVGARFLAPYRFRLDGTLRPGENQLEILVLSTLAPYLQAVSPTPYVYAGQAVSGLFGPVQLLTA